MAKWLDKYEQGGLVLKKKTKDNYGKKPNPNDVQMSAGPGFVGEGYNIKGRDYSPSWGGQFQMGGSLPGAVGFTYARTINPAPANGKYAKKTKASAQEGKKLKNAKGESEKFLKGWMDSPIYKKMINASINASPNQQEEILKAISREDQLKKMSWEFADLNADKSWLDKLSSPILGQFVQDKNKVLLNPSSNNDTLSEVGVHEGSHATDLGGINIPRSDIEKMSKYKKEYEKQKGFFTKLLDDEDFNTYVGRPTETRGRLNAIRYLGKKEGIYDPYKEKVDKDILKKLPSSIFHPTELDQLRKIYNDDQIIDLLNSVSKNDSNKLIPQAQNGKEMSFYQQGLDFKPKSISKKGKKIIKDDMGQWAHPGEITEIGSPDITMQGVDYPVLGISDTGDTQMMYPDQDYKFDGDKVTEYPMAQKGKKLTKEQLKQNIDQFLADQKPFYDYLMSKDKQLPSIEELAGNAQSNYQNFKGDNTRIVRSAPDMRTAQQKKDQEAIMDAQRKKWAANKKLKQSERYSNTQKKGSLNDPDSWHIEDKMRLFPNSIGGAGELFDDYLNPFTFVGSMADALGSSVARRDPKGAALSLGLAAGAGALGFDPLGSALKVPGKVAQSMESGLLSNAYKLNPYAFKPTEGMMYRGIGKEGMEDALQSGLFRAKQNVTPTSIGNFNTTRQFSKAYYSPRFDIADQYGKGYIAEVPRGASDWGKRYGKKEWSQIAQRDIPITEGKVLQKDWLQRYKEVPKPVAQGTANASSSNYISDLINSTKSYYEQKAGEKLAGAENRAAIAEGNKWSKEWANDPETARKIRQQIIDQKTFGNLNPEIFDRINTPETMESYRYLTSYEPQAAEFPLADQKRDLINTIKGNNIYSTPMIHGDNLGVSYKHSRNPLWDTDIYIPGSRGSGPGTWISRTPTMDQAARKSVTIHENAHDWLRENALKKLGYKDEIESHLTQDAMDANTKWVESGHDTKKNYLGYLADPTEVHARIMETRHHFGLTPTDKVTPEMAESMLEVIRQGKIPTINKQFADIFSSPKGVAQLFNKLPVVAPVAVGVGAAATALPKEQKNGGWLNKYK